VSGLLAAERGQAPRHRTCLGWAPNSMELGVCRLSSLLLQHGMGRHVPGFQPSLYPHIAT
jgi:hypothetical protein